MAVGLDSLTNLEFDPNKPYRACLLCGTIYQAPNDRKIHPTSQPWMIAAAKTRRDLWAIEHAKTHSIKMHKLLRVSGMAMTAEAAYKLAAFGLLDLTGLVLDEEVMAAYKEAPSVPQDDAHHSS